MASVKVAVRVRPFNMRELNMDSKCIIQMNLNKTTIQNLKAANEIMVNSFSDQSLNSASKLNLNLSTQSNLGSQSNLSTINSSSISSPNAANSSKNNNRIISDKYKDKEFVFDASYWSFDENDPNFISQSDVYNDLGRLTVNNAFEGYNACVCAYGQTGSGKSYSMMGQTNNAEQEGLIPRICKNLFERVEKKRTKSENNSPSSSNQNISYRAEVSYLEIYNEKVRDLLRVSDKENLKIREHPKTGVYVQGLSQYIVVNYSDIAELLNKGNLNRTTASTNMNDTSSRSHAIFTVKFSQVKFVENIPSETISKMNLVDLAGSERADSSGATGIRLKEGGNINRSLLSFINVISTLADLSGNPNNSSSKHYIPYRDSVLTWLLKDSLGGNSKTIILAAISPADVNYVETMSTLRYANRAKNIINKPTVNEDPNVKLIRDLRNEIIHLKSLLQSHTQPTAGLRSNPDIIPEYNNNNRDSNDTQVAIMDNISTNQDKINEITHQIMNKWQQKKYENYFENNENLVIEKMRNNSVSLVAKYQPYLISIDESLPEIFNGVSIYPLRHGKTLLGCNDNDNIHNDIILFGQNVQSKQCYLTRLDKRCYLCPLNGYCQLNDRILRKKSTENNVIEEDIENIELGVEIKHGDLILFGETNLFIFNNSEEEEEMEEDFDIENNERTSKRILLSYLMKKLVQSKNENIEDKMKERSSLAETEIDELKIRIQELSYQNELSQIEIKKMNDLVKEEKEEASLILAVSNQIQTKNTMEMEMETRTIISNSNLENQNQFNSEKTGENDSISRDFDQQDELNSVIEKFEKDEKLLNDSLINLNKQTSSQLKSFIFELQNLKLKEENLEEDLKKNHNNIERNLEKLHEKRDNKIVNFNRLREKLHKDQSIIELKMEMSQINTAELEIKGQINDCENLMELNLDELNSLNTELRIKKIYSLNGGEKLEDLVESEEAMIKKANDELNNIKRSKQENYNLIEIEFEKARLLMISESEQNDPELVELKLMTAQSSKKEFDLKKFLEDCLYVTEEEKCLIENELTELCEQRENLENGKVKFLKEKCKKMVDEKIEVEYKGLEDLKKHDLAEIKEDECRIELLYESTIKRIQESIKSTEESVFTNNIELKGLHEIAEMNRIKMNSLLSRFDEIEGKRITEENRLLNEEIKLAKEYKIETDKLNSQAKKLDSVFRRKKGQISKEKNLIQPKMCNLVGPYKGIQLFEANFNPAFTKDHLLEPSRMHNRSSRTLSSLFVDTNSNYYEPSPKSSHVLLSTSLSRQDNYNSLSDCNASFVSSGSSNSDSQENSNDLLSTLKNNEITSRAKFQTNSCKILGINIEINDKPVLCGKKLMGDEHYEYLIEISLGNDERWFILRRYSKIRQVHEQLSLLYPSLNCLVFPVRQYFNRELINRQLQLEHYLKCLLELLISDPTCSIYQSIEEKLYSQDNMTERFKLNATASSVSNSSSLNSFSSTTSSNLFNQAVVQNTVDTDTQTQSSCSILTKPDLCSFNHFFEQTQADRNYLSKLQLTQACYFDRKNSGSIGIQNHNRFTSIN